MNAPSLKQLEDDLSRGDQVRPEELAGYAYRGVSLGLPKLVDRLMWKTFAKVFLEHDGEVRGFNLRIIQGDDSFRPRARKPRFGEFVAVAEGDTTLLDYGRANRAWHPIAPMRDVIVATGPDTFLGRAYIAAGPLRLPTPSYFTLTRGKQVPTEASYADAHYHIDSV